MCLSRRSVGAHVDSFRRAVAHQSRSERSIVVRVPTFERSKPTRSVTMEASAATSSDTKPLSGRHAIVTGASRGVGRGIAVGLGEAGATVFITGRSSTQLENTARLVREAGGECLAFLCDHENDDEVQEFFGEVGTHLSSTSGGVPLDLLVNNAFAGAHCLAESMEIPLWNKSAVNPAAPDPNSSPGAYWDTINNVGLRSNYIATILALRMMVPAQTGCIINISSFGGTMRIFDAVYGAGKCANDRLVCDIAYSLVDPIDTGVRMLTLYPGIVSTEVMLKAVESRAASDQKHGITNDQSSESLQNLLWNAESPTFVGRVVAAIAADSNRKARNRRNGKILIAAEAGRHYGVRDVNGEQRYSLRSLRTLALTAIPSLQADSFRFWIPDIYVPWFLVKLVAGVSPGLSS
jgi:NAD(P)-dependent dehydrogenase (short-subunit alcohol dehydrogenase family)